MRFYHFLHFSQKCACPNVVLIGQAIKRVDAQAVVTYKMIRARRQKFLGSSNIFMANIVNERWAFFQIFPVALAHVHVCRGHVFARWWVCQFLVHVNVATFGLNHFLAHLALLFSSCDTEHWGNESTSSKPIVRDLLH